MPSIAPSDPSTPFGVTGICTKFFKESAEQIADGLDQFGFSGLSKKFRRDENASSLLLLDATREIEHTLRDVPDAQLREKFLGLQREAPSSWRGAEADRTIAIAAALGSEAVQRVMGFRLHDVQIRGAIATSRGAIVEMQTGEGKTVVSGVAAVIRSAIDNTVHVATTNDYLAERDHETVAPVFELLGLTSAVLMLDVELNVTKRTYECDIVYGPGYLFGFDYLRDQLALRNAEDLTLGRDVLSHINGTNIADMLLQHKHASIIVDEADSVLIDEAATPLILSGGEEENVDGQAFIHARRIAEELQEGTHFEIDRRHRTITIYESAVDYAHAALASIEKLKLSRPWSIYIKNALYANHLLSRNEHYVVQDGEVNLVDQLTGRIFDDRTLRDGLHQAVEAKEMLEITAPNHVQARITRQRFFQLYDTVCGMTGTAIGSENELRHFYDVPVMQLQPHRKSKRIELPTRFFAGWDEKLCAIVDDVKSRLSEGRPLLIGTRTIHESQLIADAFETEAIGCVVLNGIQDAEEAEIIAEAGKVGAVTIATNMAGRGTDIKLTEESRARGGLHVIGTQRHASHRVDRQLAGRAARQGDPGSCQFFVSADDELLRQYSPSLASQIASACRKSKSPPDFSLQIYRLQRRIEQNAFESRRMLVHQDNWMDAIRSSVAKD